MLSTVVVPVTGDERVDIGLLGGLLHQPANGCLAHTIALPAREYRVSRLLDAVTIPPELASGLIAEIEIGISLSALLDSTGEKNLGRLGIQIDVIPIYSPRSEAYKRTRVVRVLDLLVA